jgi:hypothetical protein
MVKQEAAHFSGAESYYHGTYMEIGAPCEPSFELMVAPLGP